MAKEEEAKKGEGEAGAPEGGAAPAPASKNKKLVVIIGAVVGVLVIAGIAAAVLLKGSAKPAQEGDPGADAAGANEPVLIPEGGDDIEELSEGEEPLGAMFPLDAFVVNLSGGRFIRCQVQLEFNSREVPRKFYPRIVLVRDTLISLLASKTQEDLASSNGRDSLKQEVRDSVNDLLRKEEVKRVYFTQFVIQ